jgi:hypothetical protein
MCGAEIAAGEGVAIALMTDSIEIGYNFAETTDLIPKLGKTLATRPKR